MLRSLQHTGGERGEMNSLPLSVSILQLSFFSPFTPSLRLPNMNKGGALNRQHGQALLPTSAHMHTCTRFSIPALPCLPLISRFPFKCLH